MATVRILSAGAAQAVTERVIEDFTRETGHEIVASFGAVGAMKARVTSRESVDVIILTNTLIGELVSLGLVEADSRFDLGKVGTGVAVRAATMRPDVSNAKVLKANLLAATRIVCPDPAIATAGKIVMSLMEKLGVIDEMRPRLQFFPNGYAAMKWLAASTGERELGITQVTEILPNKGVAYAGPLPDEFQMKAVYSLGLASNASEAPLARDFVSRFKTAAAKSLLAEAGYELER